MAEFLYAASHLTGDCPNPTNALGAPDGTWAGPTGSNSDWDSRWAIADPVNALTDSATQTIRVTARKTNHPTNPSVTVELWENGTLVAGLASTTVSSTSGQTVSGTFNSAAVTDPDAIEIRIVGANGGGKPADRASVQVDAIEWEADTSVAADPVEQLAGTLSVGIGLAGVLDVPTPSVPELVGTLGFAVGLSGVLDTPAAPVEQLAGALSFGVGLAGVLNVPAPLVPELSARLGVGIGLGGVLEQPTATVPELDGTLGFAVGFGGVLETPGSTVDALTGSLAFGIGFGGVLETPEASVPELAGSLAFGVGFGGELDAPGATPTLSGSLSVGVGFGGELAMVEASVPDLVGALSFGVGFYGRFAGRRTPAHHGSALGVSIRESMGSVSSLESDLKVGVNE